jgi:hypothetical protein
VRVCVFMGLHCAFLLCGRERGGTDERYRARCLQFSPLLRFVPPHSTPSLRCLKGNGLSVIFMSFKTHTQKKS